MPGLLPTLTARAPRRVAACLLLGACGPLAAQQGYSFADNQIRIETREHWRSWTVATGAAAITPEGAVSPRFLRKRVNAALDAPEYAVAEPGGVVAGSNQADARFLIDGDPTTSWGPDLDAPREDWWAQIRLGRLVVVERIVLRFAAEGEGEPFLHFDVLGWRHPPPLSPSKYTLTGTGLSKLWILFRTDRPNKTQREFEVLPRTTERASLTFAGDPLDVVHILVTDSDLDRMREVGEGTYLALPAVARGAVDYYRVGGGGRSTLTTRDNYLQLPQERQGRVRYFQRERPRLSEVEVWTVGDNLNLGRVTSGGQTTLQTNVAPYDVSTTVTDGDYATGPTSSLFKGKIATFIEDLGTLFWVDTLHFLMDAAGGGGIDEFSVEVSDGARAADGSILWRPMVEERRDALYRSFGIEPTRIRFLRAFFRNRSSSLSQMSLLEAMLYGEGYVAEVLLTSDPITLGNRKGLISISWDADTPKGTWVEISTRTGNGLEEEKVYHDSDGRVVTEDRYTRRLPRTKQGEVTTRPVPGRDWSPWSPPYSFAGEEIKSPRIRKHLQIRARVLADTASKYGPPATLRALRVQLADLYTDSLKGEVWPARVARIGEPEDRSFFVRTLFSNDEQGFDLVRITATSGTRMELVEVRAGRRDDFPRQSFQRVPADRVDLVPTGADTLLFRLPSPIQQGVELMEVCFRPTIYANSAAFEAAVRSTRTDGAWQIVDIGDATGAVNSQTNVVLALQDNAVLTDLRVEPVVTPNGDGVNDVALFHFSANRLRAEKVVTLSIHDLGGRLVRQLREPRADPRGRWALEWAADDAAGRPVPPGTYIARLELDAESPRAERTRLTRLLHVAY